MRAKGERDYRTLDEVAAGQMRNDPDFALHHLEQCAEDPEPRVFLRALEQLVDAQPGGIGAVAREAGVDRAGLHRALTGAPLPNRGNVARVLRALNLSVRFRYGEGPEVPPEAQG